MTLVPSQRDLRILAATMDAEAASEPDAGMIAVAQIVFNRAGNPRMLWQSGSLPYMGMIEATCMAGIGRYGQFSCWNGDRESKMRGYFIDGDPDRGWLSDTTAGRARDLLREYIDGRPAPAGLERCSHYLNPARASPAWAGRVAKGIRIGDHVFLRPDQLTPPEKAIRPVTPRPVRIQRRRTWSEKIAQAWSLAKWAWGVIGAGVAWTIDKLWSVGIDPATIDLPRLSLPAWGWRDALPAVFALACLALVACGIAYIIRTRKERPHEDPGTHVERWPPHRDNNRGDDDAPPVRAGGGGAHRERDRPGGFRNRPDGWPPSRFG